jgi:hypothetical protein
MKSRSLLLLLIVLTAWCSPHLEAQTAETPLKSYRDSHGTANATGYAYGRTWIIIQFKGDALYLYTNSSCGAEHIRELKRLARLGEGLDSYINQHVWKRYAAKLR